MAVVWTVLYDAGVDIVINGHDHDYERFSPQSSKGVLDTLRGIREFVVGTGGKSLLPFIPVIAANSELRDNATYGVLRLRLYPLSYQWDFLPAGPGRFVDSGSGKCH